MAIAGEQREIDKNYRTIGEWFVSEYEGEIPDAVRDLVEAVNTSKAKIAELESSKPGKGGDGGDEIPEASAQKVCPICGAASDSKSAPSAAPPWATELLAKETSPPAFQPAGFKLPKKALPFSAKSYSLPRARICPHFADKSHTCRLSGVFPRRAGRRGKRIKFDLRLRAQHACEAFSARKCQAHVVPHHAAVGGLGDPLVDVAEFLVVADQRVLAGEDAAPAPLGPGVGAARSSSCPAQPRRR